MSILKLTLKKQWFDLMLKGEKRIEFRKPTKWIESRAIRNGQWRSYDFVEFVNGYGADKPAFVAVFDGFHRLPRAREYHYGELVVKAEKGDILIFIGKIVEVRNISL